MSKSTKLFLLSVFTLMGVILSLLLGSVWFGLAESLKALTEYKSHSDFTTILYSFRLPRTLLASLAGAGLSLCGLLMQTYFRNPLAGPGVLGISAAASLGASISLLAVNFSFFPVWMQSASLISFAWISCFIYTILLFLLSQKLFSNLGVLLMGVMASYFINAIISIFISLSETEKITRFVYWGFGSFEGASNFSLFLIAICLLLSFLLVMAMSKSFNVFLLGDEQAGSLGVNVRFIRHLSILITCLLTSLITSICGPIGFVGLAGPHLARLVMKTSDHKWLMTSSLLCGASLSLWGDIIARLPGLTGVLPVNAVLSLIGAPLVVLLILNHHHK